MKDATNNHPDEIDSISNFAYIRQQRLMHLEQTQLKQQDNRFVVDLMHFLCENDKKLLTPQRRKFSCEGNEQTCKVKMLPYCRVDVVCMLH